MTIKSLKRGAVVAGLAGALSLAAVTSSSAAHWGRGAAIGAGAAGFALGAAAASSAPYYGYYDYAPGYAPGPYYDEYSGPYYAPVQDYGWRRPGECRFSIRGC
jgi:hypothetical protein